MASASKGCVRGVQGRRHRADLDRERRGDLAVLEVGEVAQEDDESLPLGQRGETCTKLRVTPVAAVPAKLSVAPVTKPVPVIVTAVPPAAAVGWPLGVSKTEAAGGY